MYKNPLFGRVVVLRRSPRQRLCLGDYVLSGAYSRSNYPSAPPSACVDRLGRLLSHLSTAPPPFSLRIPMMRQFLYVVYQAPHRLRDELVRHCHPTFPTLDGLSMRFARVVPALTKLCRMSPPFLAPNMKCTTPAVNPPGHSRHRRSDGRMRLASIVVLNPIRADHHFGALLQAQSCSLTTL